MSKILNITRIVSKTSSLGQLVSRGAGMLLEWLGIACSWLVQSAWAATQSNQPWEQCMWHTELSRQVNRCGMSCMMLDNRSLLVREIKDAIGMSRYLMPSAALPPRRIQCNGPSDWAYCNPRYTNVLRQSCPADMKLHGSASRSCHAAHRRQTNHAR